MKFLDTAFRQLEFAWKLYNYALEGRLDLGALDKPLTFGEGRSMLVLASKTFETPTDLVLACENNLTIAFGAAGITMNRCREEAGFSLPNPIDSDNDQFVSLCYQIRNAFAHDISEPRWAFRSARYARAYRFDRVCVDLTSVDGKYFEYADLGGPDVLFRMRDYGDQHIWP